MEPAPWDRVPAPTDYDNATHIPDGDRYFPMWRERAAAFRAALAPDRQRSLAYGAHPRQAADLFLPEGRPLGLMVFVHGGFWRQSGREDWSHLAAGALGRGWAVAMPSYPLCPEVRIGAIVQSVAAALRRLTEAMPGMPLALAGHSAGGHLVLRMVCADVAVPGVARVLSISPLSDLAPLRHVPNQADWQIAPAEAAAESPRRHPRPDVPVAVLVGAAERPAFVDQARWIAEAWAPTALHIAPDRHHFDIVEPLEDPAAPLLAALCPA